MAISSFQKEELQIRKITIVRNFDLKLHCVVVSMRSEIKAMLARFWCSTRKCNLKPSTFKTMTMGKYSQTQTLQIGKLSKSQDIHGDKILYLILAQFLFLMWRVRERSCQRHANENTMEKKTGAWTSEVKSFYNTRRHTWISINITDTSFNDFNF